MTLTYSILRRPEVERRLGKPRSSLYRDITLGLLPKPIRISAQSVGWPSNEVDQLVAARIAGKSETEIKTLVTKLTAARADLQKEAA